jgi:hypothetical protein
MLDHPSAVFTATSCGLVWRGQPLVASLPPERMITALLTRTVAALGAASGALSLYDTRHGGHRLVALTGNDYGGSRAARVVRDDALPAFP